MVRDPKRISEIMSLLGEYWTLNPDTMDLRLGQIISIAVGGHASKGNSVFYLEDEELIIELKRLIVQAKTKMQEDSDKNG